MALTLVAVSLLIVSHGDAPEPRAGSPHGLPEEPGPDRAGPWPSTTIRSRGAAVGRARTVSRVEATGHAGTSWKPCWIPSGSIDFTGVGAMGGRRCLPRRSGSRRDRRGRGLCLCRATRTAGRVLLRSRSVTGRPPQATGWPRGALAGGFRADRRALRWPASSKATA